MQQGLQTLLYDKDRQAQQLISRLAQQQPKARLQASNQEVSYLSQRLTKAMKIFMRQKKINLQMQSNPLIC